MVELTIKAIGLPMAIYHVFVTRREHPERFVCLLPELPLGALREQFIKPYMKGGSLLCRFQIVDAADIQRVKIIKTPGQARDLPAYIVAGHSSRDIVDYHWGAGKVLITAPPAEPGGEPAIEVGEDVTPCFMPGSPPPATAPLVENLRRNWVWEVAGAALVILFAWWYVW